MLLIWCGAIEKSTWISTRSRPSFKCTENPSHAFNLSANMRRVQLRSCRDGHRLPKTESARICRTSSRSERADELKYARNGKCDMHASSSVSISPTEIFSMWSYKLLASLRVPMIIEGVFLISSCVITSWVVYRIKRWASRGETWLWLLKNIRTWTPFPIWPSKMTWQAKFSLNDQKYYQKDKVLSRSMSVSHRTPKIDVLSRGKREGIWEIRTGNEVETNSAVKMERCCMTEGLMNVIPPVLLCGRMMGCGAVRRKREEGRWSSLAWCRVKAKRHYKRQHYLCLSVCIYVV